MQRVTTILLFALTFTTAASIDDKVAAADNVQITTKSGQTIVGQLHSRTSSDRLWLRFDLETTVLLKSYRWSDVSTVNPTTVDSSRHEIRFVSHGQATLTFADMARYALSAKTR